MPLPVPRNTRQQVREPRERLPAVIARNFFGVHIVGAIVGIVTLYYGCLLKAQFGKFSPALPLAVVTIVVDLADIIALADKSETVPIMDIGLAALLEFLGVLVSIVSLVFSVFGSIGNISGDHNPEDEAKPDPRGVWFALLWCSVVMMFTRLALSIMGCVGARRDANRLGEQRRAQGNYRVENGEVLNAR